jgi:hypothetical protein
MPTFTRPLSDRQLLDQSAHGRFDAADALVERHLASALVLAQHLAGESAPKDRVLDAVHDAFITAFDEALEDGRDSLEPMFHRLLKELALAARYSHSDDEDSARHPRLSFNDRHRLRQDIVAELRVTIAIHADSPRGWPREHGLAREFRVLRRGVRARIETLRGSLPTAVVRSQPLQ